MSLRRTSLFVVVHLAGIAAAGCSSSSDASAPDPSNIEDAGPVHATFEFFSERDGFAKPVSSIVYIDRFHVRVHGLPRGSDVTITYSAYSPYAKGRGYTSSATFVADDSGAIDTGTMAPKSGSYSGVDSDGLVWSSTEGKLSEGLGQRTSAFFTARIGEETVGEGELGRLNFAPGIHVETVTTDGLVGELFVPEGTRDAVPIVAFGGSEGGITGGEWYAAKFASWGHPVLALAYFGAPGVPRELAEIPLEYFDKAFGWLDGRPELRKGRVVVMGGSRGGELALQLGATFPRVVGVLAEAPSSHRWAGLSTTEKAAWAFESNPLPFVPSSYFAKPTTRKMPNGDLAFVLRTVFERDMKDAAVDALEAARIPVEKSHASILMIGGSDDALWPSCDFIERAMKRLDESGHTKTYGDEGVCLPGAGHSVGSLGLPTTESMWSLIGGTPYALGGTAEANARGARAASVTIRAFLERVTR